MPATVTVMNNNRKKIATPKKRGPKGHFQGYKLKYLLDYAEQYQTALDVGTTGAFYDARTREFIEKYGESQPWNSLDAEEPPDPTDIDFDEDLPEPTVEEAAASRQLFNKLCTV